VALLIDDNELCAGVRRGSMCRIAEVGDLVAHSAGQPKSTSVLQFGDEFALKNEKDMSSVAPMICDVPSTVFDVSYANFTHRRRPP